MSPLSLALSGATGLCLGAGLFPVASQVSKVLACENECEKWHTYRARTKLVVAVVFAAVCVALALGSNSPGEGVIGASFAWLLILLALVDYETLVLPDAITIPLICVGVFANFMGWRTSVLDSITGAILAFVALWMVNAFRRIRKGEDGMGQGDFKLAAGIGAWMGVAAVPPMLLIAAATGLLVVAIRGGGRADDFVPFGPFLAGAGLVLLVAGSDPVARLTAVI